MTTTPEGLTITGPEDLYSHADVYRFLRGRKPRLYPEVAKVTTVTLTDVTYTSTATAWSSSHGVKITIYLSTCASSSFRVVPWSQALHEWGHAVYEYHRYTTHEQVADAYLNWRGLVGHPKLGTSYVWTATEMFAEDYRMAFRTDADERPTYMNRDLPPLPAGARRWFNRTWRGLA